MESHRYQLKADDRWSSHGRILEWAGEGQGRTALDVGSAQGELAAMLRDRGFAVTCVESDPSLAVQARGRGLVVHVVEIGGDQDLPLGRFDVIVLGDVLEHLANPARALRSVTRHLAPKGIVLVSVPNVAHIWMRASLLLGRFEYADRGILDRTHLRFFTRSSFQELLLESGARIVRFAATPVPLQLVVPVRFQGPWLWAVQRMQALLAEAWKRMFGYQFVAACRWGAD